jgi:hypothetical protein
MSNNFIDSVGSSISLVSLLLSSGGLGEHSQYSDLLGAGWSGDRIPVRVKFSIPFQTGPPNLMHNGYRVSFPVVKWLGHGVNQPFASYYTAYEDGKDSVFLMLAHKIQMLGNTHKKEYNIQNSESLKRRLKKEAIPLFPFWACMACYRENFTFYIYLVVNYILSIFIYIC